MPAAGSTSPAHAACLSYPRSRISSSCFTTSFTSLGTSRPSKRHLITHCSSSWRRRRKSRSYWPPRRRPRREAPHHKRRQQRRALMALAFLAPLQPSPPLLFRRNPIPQARHPRPRCVLPNSPKTRRWSPSATLAPSISRSSHSFATTRILCSAAASLHTVVPLQGRQLSLTRWAALRDVHSSES